MIALSGLEEGVVVLVQGLRQSIDQVLGRYLHLVIARALMLFLLLLPYVAFLQTE